MHGLPRASRPGGASLVSPVSRYSELRTVEEISMLRALPHSPGSMLLEIPRYWIDSYYKTVRRRPLGLLHRAVLLPNFNTYLCVMPI